MLFGERLLEIFEMGQFQRLNQLLLICTPYETNAENRAGLFVPTFAGRNLMHAADHIMRVRQ